MSHSDHNEEEKDYLKEELPKGVIIKEHSYDGIHEYDQRLPKWWLLTLYGAIAFAALYWFIMDVKDFEGRENRQIDAQMAAIQALKLANSIDVTNDSLFWEMSGNSDFVSAGEATFQANCVACHGAKLEGGIGFNLVDAEWVHGAKPSEIYVTVSAGVPDKGMQAWENQLGQKKIVEVVAYILNKNDRATMEAAIDAAPQKEAETAPATADSQDSELVAQGQAVFQKNCVPCHSATLKGVPNLGSDLTDSVWANGGSKEELIHTVSDGIIEKGMVPWKALLSGDEIEAVVEYILSKAE